VLQVNCQYTKNFKTYVSENVYKNNKEGKTAQLHKAGEKPILNVTPRPSGRENLISILTSNFTLQNVHI
jgi:hypothetical protein